MIFFGFFGVLHINRGQTEYNINSWILPNKVVAFLLLLKGLTMATVLGILLALSKFPHTCLSIVRPSLRP